MAKIKTQKHVITVPSLPICWLGLLWKSLSTKVTFTSTTSTCSEIAQKDNWSYGRSVAIGLCLSSWFPGIRKAFLSPFAFSGALVRDDQVRDFWFRWILLRV